MKTINTDRSLRRFQVAGYISIFLMVAVFGAWSALAMINGAVIASATIVAESSTKRIQQKDGGIIRSILVKDGDRVTAGQDLVVLDDTETKAELGIIDSLLVENLAKRARLEAQRNNAGAIVFPDELTSRAGDPNVAKVMQGQSRLFESRVSTIKGKKSELDQQVAQITEQISGLEAQIASNNHQIELIKAELVGLHVLQGKELVPISRVLSMEREEARLGGVSGQLVASKASAGGRIAEIKLQILQIDEEDRTQSLTELRDAEGRIAELVERKSAAAAKLHRVTIKSPVEGDVYQLAVHTIGGVVAPGETLMLIVPLTDELVLLAQVLPQNIDQVEVGQKATVRFPALNSRFTPEVGADVVQVSADVSRADQNSPPFYSVRLRIPATELAKLDGRKLKAGMPAEAFIQTTSQSPLSYLVKPLADQIAHTFREK